MWPEGVLTRPKQGLAGAGMCEELVEQPKVRSELAWGHVQDKFGGGHSFLASGPGPTLGSPGSSGGSSVRSSGRSYQEGDQEDPPMEL